MIFTRAHLVGMAIGAGGVLLAKPALRLIIKGGILAGRALNVAKEEIKEEFADIKAEAVADLDKDQ